MFFVLRFKHAVNRDKGCLTIFPAPDPYQHIHDVASYWAEIKNIYLPGGPASFHHKSVADIL